MQIYALLAIPPFETYHILAFHHALCSAFLHTESFHRAKAKPNLQKYTCVLSATHNEA